MKATTKKTMTMEELKSGVQSAFIIASHVVARNVISESVEVNDEHNNNKSAQNCLMGPQQQQRQKRCAKPFFILNKSSPKTVQKTHISRNSFKFPAILTHSKMSISKNRGKRRRIMELTFFVVFVAIFIVLPFSSAVGVVAAQIRLETNSFQPNSASSLTTSMKPQRRTSSPASTQLSHADSEHYSNSIVLHSAESESRSSSSSFTELEKNMRRERKSENYQSRSSANIDNNDKKIVPNVQAAGIQHSDHDAFSTDARLNRHFSASVASVAGATGLAESLPVVQLGQTRNGANGDAMRSSESKRLSSTSFPSSHLKASFTARSNELFFSYDYLVIPQQHSSIVERNDDARRQINDDAWNNNNESDENDLYNTHHSLRPGSSRTQSLLVQPLKKEQEFKSQMSVVVEKKRKNRIDQDKSTEEHRIKLASTHSHPETEAHNFANTIHKFETEQNVSQNNNREATDQFRPVDNSFVVQCRQKIVDDVKSLSDVQRANSTESESILSRSQIQYNCDFSNLQFTQLCSVGKDSSIEKNAPNKFYYETLQKSSSMFNDASNSNWSPIVSDPLHSKLKHLSSPSAEQLSANTEEATNFRNSREWKNPEYSKKSQGSSSLQRVLEKIEKTAEIQETSKTTKNSVQVPLLKNFNLKFHFPDNRDISSGLHESRDRSEESAREAAWRRTICSRIVGDSWMQPLSGDDRAQVASVVVLVDTLNIGENTAQSSVVTNDAVNSNEIENRKTQKKKQNSERKSNKTDASIMTTYKMRWNFKLQHNNHHNDADVESKNLHDKNSTILKNKKSTTTHKATNIKEEETEHEQNEHEILVTGVRLLRDSSDNNAKLFDVKQKNEQTKRKQKANTTEIRSKSDKIVLDSLLKSRTNVALSSRGDSGGSVAILTSQEVDFDSRRAGPDFGKKLTSELERDLLDRNGDATRKQSAIVTQTKDNADATFEYNNNNKNQLSSHHEQEQERSSLNQTTAASKNENKKKTKQQEEDRDINFRVTVARSKRTSNSHSNSGGAQTSAHNNNGGSSSSNNNNDNLSIVRENESQLKSMQLSTKQTLLLLPLSPEHRSTPTVEEESNEAYNNNNNKRTPRRTISSKISTTRESLLLLPRARTSFLASVVVDKDDSDKQEPEHQQQTSRVNSSDDATESKFQNSSSWALSSVHPIVNGLSSNDSKNPSNLLKNRRHQPNHETKKRRSKRQIAQGKVIVNIEAASSTATTQPTFIDGNDTASLQTSEHQQNASLLSFSSQNYTKPAPNTGSDLPEDNSASQQSNESLTLAYSEASPIRSSDTELWASVNNRLLQNASSSVAPNAISTLTIDSRQAIGDTSANVAYTASNNVSPKHGYGVRLQVESNANSTSTPTANASNIAIPMVRPASKQSFNDENENLFVDSSPENDSTHSEEDFRKQTPSERGHSKLQATPTTSFEKNSSTTTHEISLNLENLFSTPSTTLTSTSTTPKTMTPQSADRAEETSAAEHQLRFQHPNHCAPEFNSGMVWPITDSGVLALQSCPSPSYFGTVYRPCYAAGHWGDVDLTDCRLRTLQSIAFRVRQHVTKHLFDGLPELAHELAQLLLPSSSSSGDVVIEPRGEKTFDKQPHQQRKQQSDVASPESVGTKNKENHFVADARSLLHSPVDRNEALQLLNMMFAHLSVEQVAGIDRRHSHFQRVRLFFTNTIELMHHLIVETTTLDGFSANDRTGMKSQSPQQQRFGEYCIRVLHNLQTSLVSLLRWKILVRQEEYSTVSFAQISTLWAASPLFTPSLTSLDQLDACQLGIEIELSQQDTKDSHTVIESSGSRSLCSSTITNAERIHFPTELTQQVAIVQGRLSASVWSAALPKKEHHPHRARLYSDVHLIAIVPTVSIDVDFEHNPMFELSISIRTDLDDDGSDDENNQVRAGNNNDDQTKTKTTFNYRDSRLNDANNPAIVNSEKAETPSGRLAANDNSIKPGHHSSQSGTQTPNIVECARLVQRTSSTSDSIWTRSGCEVLDRNFTHIRCGCTQVGYIALVGFRMASVVTGASPIGVSLDGATEEAKILSKMPRVETLEAQVEAEEEFERASQFQWRNIVHHQLPVLSGTDVMLYVSFGASIAFLLVTLVVQYQRRRFEQRIPYFVIRNLTISLLAIQATFLAGTSAHLNLFWQRVVLASASEMTTDLRRTKHILCLAVPVFLHFIHLAALFWMFGHTLWLNDTFRRLTMRTTSKLNQGECCNGEQQHHPTAELLNVTGAHYRRRFLRRNKHRSRTYPHDDAANIAKQTGNNNATRKKLETPFCWAPKTKLGPNVEKSRKTRRTESRAVSTVATSASSFGRRSRCIRNSLMAPLTFSISCIRRTLLRLVGGQFKFLMFHRHCGNNEKKHNSYNNISSATSFKNKCNSLKRPTENATMLNITSVEPTAPEQTEMQIASIFAINKATQSPKHCLTSSTLTDSASKKNCHASSCFSPFSDSALLLSSFDASRWDCRHLMALAMGPPFALVVGSFALNPRGYETHKFCWMSIEGGIQYSFVIPVLGLILLNTCRMLVVMKRFLQVKNSFVHSESHLKVLKPSLRASVILLPFFAFNWFLSILSLETLTTPVFECLFAISNVAFSALFFELHCRQRFRLRFNCLEHLYRFAGIAARHSSSDTDSDIQLGESENILLEKSNCDYEMRRTSTNSAIDHLLSSGGCQCCEKIDENLFNLSNGIPTSASMGGALQLPPGINLCATMAGEDDEELIVVELDEDFEEDFAEEDDDDEDDCDADTDPDEFDVDELNDEDVKMFMDISQYQI